MFNYAFMQYAFIAGIFIALICAVMGVFVIARQTSFFAHTLSEIGFSGASFGVFAGISPLAGMLLFTCCSALFIGFSGEKVSRRESSISVFSGIFLGLGVLFLSLSDKQANYATSILFGSIVGIDATNLRDLVCLSIFLLILIFFTFRKLAFNSFDAQGSEYNQRYNKLISILFLLMLALTVSITAQIIGALLIFVLLTIPASASKYYAHSLWKMIGLTFIFAITGIWIGLYLSYLTNWPVSFFITVIEALIYGSAILKQKISDHHN
ncbi:metal ABC transporter permease [Ligilactobacillus aviarius]|uniref:ABC transporter permease n=1 Tax=Ligilactobacillus aviarius TaxID=1606 RepID=A0A510WU77_9LACO|nr:metal ABC transporter permease [Ligilactobacillus aviarius]KRM39585.1 cation ABC superfamily ATP binding cassette transporter, membrane protein [Ligilactobacillus aviarius subsp. aviarius DSM 20655]GEK42127.1 ABC transporter permease [Ligilactobacillus aviarius]